MVCFFNFGTHISVISERRTVAAIFEYLGVLNLSTTLFC